MKKTIKNASKQFVVVILTFFAKKVLKKYKPKIVAVTGSVGKTTTKDAIYTCLEPYKKVRKSEKSFNSEIGVPLTILGCKNAWSNPFLWLDNFLKSLFLVLFKHDYPEWLVLEIGADRRGDIKSISEWLRPDIVVLTRLPTIPVHVEYFSSPEEVANEKMFLVKALKEDGTLVFNADDANVGFYTKEIESKKISYGIHGPADVFASDILIESSAKNGSELPIGLVFDLNYKNYRTSVSISNSLGSHIALSCAAASAVGIAVGLTLQQVSEGLSMFISPTGRMNLIPGIKNSIIIDDSYNSSPAALEEALETLSKITVPGRKVAVLGDMLELGIYSADEHKRLGKKAGEICNLLVAVGLRAKMFAEGALDAKMNENNVFQYDDSSSAGKEFQNLLKEGDIILVKGSQGVRMEKFIEEIMADPTRKSELLVRQSKEWEKR